MKIHVAEHGGFCFGVRRAVDMALAQADPQKRVYTLGEIIHNPAVVQMLKEKNVFPVDSIDDLQQGDTLIIRSHGVPPRYYARCEEKQITVIDATCPFVRRIQQIAKRCAQESKQLVVVGEPAHPEVIGICGWAEDRAIVVRNAQECEAVALPDQVCVVAQTTLQQKRFDEVVAALKQKCTKVEVHQSICDTTRARQAEAVELAQKCDVMIVVGGKCSSNTQQLAQLCKIYCQQTVCIEKSSELVLEKIRTNGIIGVVAGASTPDRMIREVVTVMSEQERANKVKEAVKKPATESMDSDSSFAEAFEKTLVRIRNGQIITGTVVQIVDGEVCVNIGYKSDGFIPRSEFSFDPDVNPAEVVKVGDSIEVEVMKVNDGEGNVLLSRKNVEGKKLWEELMEDAETPDKVFNGVGKEVVKGGLIATIKGVRAFVPASQVSIRYVENLNEFVGKPMKLAIVEVDKARKRIVASQKKVLQAEAEVQKKEKWNELTVGSKLQGVVRRITDFGAFVDIGGVDGLVHVTDVAWGRVKHPSDILKIGQEIEVLVLNIDAEKERISLGYKQLQPKPWTMAGEKYPVGSIVEGKVVRIVPFGAFVALEPTIDGLIHISQVSVKRIAKVEDEINIGDMVRCKVLDVNPEAKRISLSRREVILEENPEIAEQLAQEQAERERAYAERQEQREAERQAREQQRAERAAAAANNENRSAARQQNAERPERTERRGRRNSEDGEYELPPIQTTTTSLADLFQNFKVEE